MEQLPKESHEERISKLKAQYQQMFEPPSKTSAERREEKSLKFNPQLPQDNQEALCHQSYAKLLDICQMIYQKFLTELRNYDAELPIDEYVNIALQIAYAEIHKLEAQNEQIYPLLFRILQEAMFFETKRIGETPSWRSLFGEKEGKQLSKAPYKIFFFFFRMLTIILFTLKTTLEREQKQQIAHSILEMLQNAIVFLQQGRKCCPLKEMFAYFRKHELGVEDTCECIEAEAEIIPTEPSAQAPSAPAQEIVFHGSLAQINLWQILQMLGTEQTSGCLHIESTMEAKVYIANGIVIHCECGEFQGEPAFYQLMYFKEGHFAFIANVLPEVQTMNHTIEGLLLDIAQRLDSQS